MSVAYNSLNCTARWRPRSTGGLMFWKCTACGAIGLNCMENREAAMRENLMGEKLDQLSRKGRDLLDRS